MRLYVSENQLKITANNPEQEEAEEILDVSYPGTELEIGFNVSYVLDVLNALKCENVRILLTDSVSSRLQIEVLPAKRGLCCYANETVMSLTRLLIRDFRNIGSRSCLSPWL